MRVWLCVVSVAMMSCAAAGAREAEDSQRVRAATGAPADSSPTAPSARGVEFERMRLQTLAGAEVESQELTGLVFLPAGRGALVWNKSGTLSHYALREDGFILLDAIQLPEIFDAGDCGLISVAVDPDWDHNGLIYAAHCVSQTYSQVTRYEFRADGFDRIATSRSTVIALGEHSASRPWHNVGSIGFFADAERSMWILAGEKALPEHAQDLRDNLGAILRIVPARAPESTGYSPHPENPFGGPGSNPDAMSSPDLYAWGFRSPWRGAIDRFGRVWVADVGDAVEEINVATRPGQNFGWSAMQGPCEGAGCEGLTDPVTFWPRSSDHRYRVDDALANPSTLRVAWIGVPYTRGGPDVYAGYLDDALLFSDMCIGYVRALGVDSEGRVTRDEHVGHLAGLSGAAQGPDGYLYVTAFGGCTSETGTNSGIYRVVLNRGRSDANALVPTAPTRPLVEDPLGPMPSKLSATGIFANSDRTRPIDRAVQYEPAYPLWSNGSQKRRWLLLPNGTRVDESDPAHWSFPPGTLFFKTFAYGAGDGFPIETRVIRRTADAWEYYVYGWQDEDADLLTLKHSVELSVFDGEASSTHVIPSRFDCRSCHENGPSPILGFTELQLTKGIEAADPQTRGVLGYLHGNCAHCHNGSPLAMTTLDLRPDRALANLIDVPTQGSGQISGIRLVPGAPEQSILYRALIATGSDPEIKPMPPLGVQVPDAAAIERIRTWIYELPRSSPP